MYVKKLDALENVTIHEALELWAKEKEDDVTPGYYRGMARRLGDKIDRMTSVEALPKAKEARKIRKPL